ncbi:zinc ribbon domain-containing protein [Nocardioides sp.]|uniref:zinc ribbon domain-containing protein n=1 Tax=Nocardioides sp. TaxID=35761 RepID=UPI003BEEDAFC
MLDLQELDAKADQLRHQRRTLPELAEIEALEPQRAELASRVREAELLVEELSSEQAKIDADVESARARRTRDQERVDQGVISNPKDLQRMLHELESLDRRITSLEDQELEVMERLEEAQQAHDSLVAQLTASEERLATLVKSRDERSAVLDEQLRDIAAERSPLADGLPADLLALYDKLRESKGGVGAAPLRAGECGGCRLTVDPAELATIRAAGVDEVIRCEECQRILVRTSESGL